MNEYSLTLHAPRAHLLADVQALRGSISSSAISGIARNGLVDSVIERRPLEAEATWSDGASRDIANNVEPPVPPCSLRSRSLHVAAIARLIDCRCARRYQ